jgi:hypothetical protein
LAPIRSIPVRAGVAAPPSEEICATFFCAQFHAVAVDPVRSDSGEDWRCQAARDTARQYLRIQEATISWALSRFRKFRKRVAISAAAHACAHVAEANRAAATARARVRYTRFLNPKDVFFVSL